MDRASVSIRRARPLLGTFVEIAVSGAAASASEAAVEAAFSAIAKVHRLMSFHDANSDVSRLNREASSRPVAVDDWTSQVLGCALELHRRSAGAFDIAVAPILQRRGILPQTGSGPGRQPSVSSGSIALLSENRVRFETPGAGIDLGGIAKGFAVDRAIDTLKEQGMPGGLVNAGGDLAAFGGSPAIVHLRDPCDFLQPLGSTAIENQALASSGRLFDPLNHSEAGSSAIVNPATGEPVTEITGASVRAPSCMIADALTKIVMIKGAACGRILREYGASALFVSADGTISAAEDWEGDALAA